MNKFNVGDWWRNRRGDYIQITRVDLSKPEYPIKTSQRYLYTSSGKYLGFSSLDHELDLVQKMKTPAWEEDISYPHKVVECWEAESGEFFMILKIKADKTALVEPVDDCGTRKGVDYRCTVHLSRLKRRVEFKTVCKTVMEYLEF